MAKRKKYSMNDRIKYFIEKRHSTKSETAFARYTGFLDSVTGQNIDSSMFKTDKEKNSYYKGVDKGHKMFRRMNELKF